MAKIEVNIYSILYRQPFSWCTFYNANDRKVCDFIYEISWAEEAVLKRFKCCAWNTPPPNKAEKGGATVPH
jgi:hypothetical protein